MTKKEEEVNLAPILSNVDLEPPTWANKVSPQKLYKILGPYGFDSALWCRYNPDKNDSAFMFNIRRAFFRTKGLKGNVTNNRLPDLLLDEYTVFFKAFKLLAKNEKTQTLRVGWNKPKATRLALEEHRHRQQEKEQEKMKNKPISDNCMFDLDDPDLDEDEVKLVREKFAESL